VAGPGRVPWVTTLQFWNGGVYYILIFEIYLDRLTPIEAHRCQDIYYPFNMFIGYIADVLSQWKSKYAASVGQPGAQTFGRQYDCTSVYMLQAFL